MIVNVTETFRVNIDNYGNHQPEFFKESSVIETGKYTGQMSNAKWVGVGKYYRNIAQAIWWGIENGCITDEHEQVVDGSVGVREYLERIEDMINRLESLLNTTQSK
jgi:hypothetical protein